MNDKLKNIIVIVTFITIIFGMLFLNLIKEDEQISITERRKLATMPNFTVKELISRKLCN